MLNMRLRFLGSTVEHMLVPVHPLLLAP